MAEPYGGQSWIEQQIYAAVQAAMQQINWSQLMGYGYPSMYGPGAQRAPSLNEAYYAIYESRPDLQEQKERKYADWSVTRYMQQWWEGSGEMAQGRHWTDPATGIEWVNTKDVTAVEFAIARGYIDPGPEPAKEYGMQPTVGYMEPKYEGDPSYVQPPWEQWAIAGEREPTLERERFEQAREEWTATQLRLAGLDEEAIRQFNETMRFYRDQFGEDIREADRQYLRQIGLDDTAIAQWEREQARIEGMDAEYIRQANREFLRQQGLDIEGIRQFDVQHEFAKWQAQQQQANVEWEQLRLTGLDEQAAYQFQQTHQLAREQFEVGNVQWEAQFGLEQQYFGLSEQQLQLQQLQTMLGLTGPTDWPQYWAAGRAMPEAWGPAGEPIPAWARTLTEGGQYPAFGAAGQVPQGIYGGITPWQVSPQQWAGLTPSEIQGLSGQVQTAGGWMPDWMQQMQASWPQGQATPISYFGT